MRHTIKHLLFLIQCDITEHMYSCGHISKGEYYRRIKHLIEKY